jgi:hypothetical protein
MEMESKWCFAGEDAGFLHLREIRQVKVDI